MTIIFMNVDVQISYQVSKVLWHYFFKSTFYSFLLFLRDSSNVWIVSFNSILLVLKACLHLFSFFFSLCSSDNVKCASKITDSFFCLVQSAIATLLNPSLLSLYSSATKFVLFLFMVYICLLNFSFCSCIVFLYFVKSFIWFSCRCLSMLSIIILKSLLGNHYISISLGWVTRCLLFILVKSCVSDFHVSCSVL